MNQQSSASPPSPLLITGAGGFIGSHLVEECLARGCRVRALVRYNSRNHFGWLEGIDGRDGLEVVAGDVRDFERVLAVMQGCRGVFHLAALIGIPYSYLSPLAYLRTNVEGTYNVLEAARRLELQTIVVTSTSETYGTAQYAPIDENHPAVGQSPYAASKIAADQFAISFHRSFGLPVKIVRPFNAYGPRQSARALIPTVISQLLNGRETLSLGNLSPTRDLTYVRDVAEGFLAIANAASLEGEATNIGSGVEISMRELVATICRLVGRQVEVVCESERVRPKASEVDRLVCDPSKIFKSTGWRPRYDLERGLVETISWIEGHLPLFKTSCYVR